MPSDIEPRSIICNSILHAKCFNPSKAQVINDNFYCIKCKHSNELKQSISSIQSSQHPGPSITTTPSLAPPHETLLTTLPDQPTPHLPHDQVPVTDMKPDFIQSTESDKLTAFLQSCSFKSENGHSVVSFGEPYHYTGSKSSQNVPPIPEDLKPLFEEMNKVQTELYNKCYPEQPHLTAPIINSCLINRYDGPESHLPNHSDREVTIHPESSILTLSLGQRGGGQ